LQTTAANMTAVAVPMCLQRPLNHLRADCNLYRRENM